MLWYQYRTVSHTSRRDSSKKAQLMTEDNTHKHAWGNRYLSKEKIQQCFEKDCYCSHAHSFAVLLTYLGAGYVPTWFDS